MKINQKVPTMDLTRFQTLVRFAQDGSRLPDSDMHGDAHWRAVAAQGLEVASLCNLGSKGRQIAALFGLFHDCRRENEHYDPSHGARAADALNDCAEMPNLAPGLSARLTHSLIMHDNGQVSDDPLVGLGWDADRSLLTRCGMDPDIAFFSCITASDFDPFIERGRAMNHTAPTWDEIWELAFARD